MAREGDSMSISGQIYPRELVKVKFLKLNMSHVEYVMDCLLKNTTKVRNIKAYLLATLFNAGSTMFSYYRAEVNQNCISNYKVASRLAIQRDKIPIHH